MTWCLEPIQVYCVIKQPSYCLSATVDNNIVLLFPELGFTDSFINHRCVPITRKLLKIMPKARSTTHRIKRYYPPCILRAHFSSERLLTPPLSTVRTVFPLEENTRSGSIPSDFVFPCDTQSLIPKPGGEVTRIKRGGYNLAQASGLPVPVYESIQVRSRHFLHIYSHG
jgi:hypothetical protein